MTANQTATIDRAVSRAHHSGLHLVGHGYRRADGAQVFAVSSASDAVLTAQAKAADRRPSHETALLMPVHGNQAVSIWK
jgi:hypothetical protein